MVKRLGWWLGQQSACFENMRTRVWALAPTWEAEYSDTCCEPNLWDLGEGGSRIPRLLAELTNSGFRDRPCLKIIIGSDWGRHRTLIFDPHTHMNSSRLHAHTCMQKYKHAYVHAHTWGGYTWTYLREKARGCLMVSILITRICNYVVSYSKGNFVDVTK